MPQPRVQLSVEEYLAEALALVAPLEAETVPLAEASGRVLAADVASRGAVPAFANSAMDGYAVRHAELSAGVRLRVVADVPAGSPADPAFGGGECVRIMTGAPVPSAADTIVPIELTDEGRRVVVVRRVPDAGSHVREAGGDLAAGDVVVTAGTRVSPAVASAIAGAGHGQVSVSRRPRVGVGSTGDELVPPGGELGRGQIYESNAAFLAAALSRDGAEPVRRPPLPDDPARFRAGLGELAAASDLVVLTGGVSVGDHDVVRIVLGEGDAAFRHVQMQPGRPQGWARFESGGRTVPVLCLPGNPLSTMVSYELFVRAAVERMLGAPPRPWTMAVAASGWPSPAGRRQFQPVTADADLEGRRTVRAAHRRGSASHLITAFAGADALADVPADTDRVEAGALVPIRSLL